MYLLQKIVAIFLCLIVVSPNVTFAVANESSSAASHTSTSSTYEISIPSKLGVIEESYKGTSDKTIIYIQDAHVALDAQENIAETIEFLVEKHGIKTVFEEGFEGPVPTDKYFGFMTDVAGVPELGATSRGAHMEVTTYIEKGLSSELSGNIIDLCPVGALTSKAYAYRARPWELKKTETIDVLDAVGANIRVDSRGNEVLRILPRLNEQVNEEWISDKSRHAFEGLKNQRLDKPYIRRLGKLQPTTWNEAYEAVINALKNTPPEKIGAIFLKFPQHLVVDTQR